MSSFDYILFTTCDNNQNRLEELIRLLKSIDNQIEIYGLKIQHYVLIQRATVLPEMLSDFVKTSRIFSYCNSQLSLSRARNLMLYQAKNDALLGISDICAFPDDDAWYPDGLLTGIAKVFKKYDTDIFVCDYGSSPSQYIDPSESLNCEETKSCGKYISQVSSNTLFLKASLADSVGYFDEALGVGAPINGGEDLDYALRAFRVSGKKAILLNQKLVGHRDRLQWVRSKYYAGSLFAIARNSTSGLCAYMQFVRKVLVGLYLVLRQEHTLKDYLSGIKTGLGGLNIKNPKVKAFV